LTQRKFIVSATLSATLKCDGKNKCVSLCRKTSNGVRREVSFSLKFWNEIKKLSDIIRSTVHEQQDAVATHMFYIPFFPQHRVEVYCTEPKRYVSIGVCQERINARRRSHLYLSPSEFDDLMMLYDESRPYWSIMKSGRDRVEDCMKVYSFQMINQDHLVKYFVTKSQCVEKAESITGPYVISAKRVKLLSNENFWQLLCHLVVKRKTALCLDKYNNICEEVDIALLDEVVRFASGKFPQLKCHRYICPKIPLVYPSLKDLAKLNSGVYVDVFEQVVNQWFEENS